MRETQSEVYRSQSTLCLPKRGSCFKSRSECVTEKLSMCCCNLDGQAKDRVKNSVMIGSKEVGGVGEEFNVVKPDEYTNEVQHVFYAGSARWSLTQDCCETRDKLGVYRKRPKQWALSSPVSRDSNTGATMAWPNSNSASLSVLCSPSSDDESAQQGHIARQAGS